MASQTAEIKEILPKQSTAIANTESFATFRKHLRTLAPSPKLLFKKADSASLRPAIYCEIAISLKNAGVLARMLVATIDRKAPKIISVSATLPAESCFRRKVRRIR